MSTIIVQRKHICITLPQPCVHGFGCSHLARTTTRTAFTFFPLWLLRYFKEAIVSHLSWASSFWGFVPCDYVQNDVMIAFGTSGKKGTSNRQSCKVDASQNIFIHAMRYRFSYLLHMFCGDRARQETAGAEFTYQAGIASIATGSSTI